MRSEREREGGCEIRRMIFRFAFRMVRELIAIQNYEQIERICRILSEHFVLSQNGNFRRGGLIGIAALAIACGKVNCSFIED